MTILISFFIDYQVDKLCLIHISHNIILLHQEVLEFILDNIYGYEIAKLMLQYLELLQKRRDQLPFFSINIIMHGMYSERNHNHELIYIIVD